MNLINLENVVKAYGPQPLLDGVSLGVETGMRIGIVGRNGGGKSTLMAVMARLLEPDSGRVTHTGGLRLAHLVQRDEFAPDATVRSVVLGDRAEHEWAGDAGVRAILDGLGMPHLGLDTPVGPMSGGERRRVALAALLVRDADLLVLHATTVEAGEHRLPPVLADGGHGLVHLAQRDADLDDAFASLTAEENQ